MAKEPRSALARYAYGYSDEKPGWSYWLVIAFLIVGAIMLSVKVEVQYPDPASQSSQ